MVRCTGVRIIFGEFYVIFLYTEMAKKYLNTKDVDSIVRKARRMVPLPEQAYMHGAHPAGYAYISHVLNTHNMGNKNRERLEKLNRDYFKRLTNVHSSKNNENRAFLEKIPNWTFGPYQNIQRARRGYTSSNSRNNNVFKANGDSKNVDYALTKYFRETDVRAPHRPNRFRKVDYLYRAVDLSKVPRGREMLVHGIFRDKGFMSFSRNIHFAESWIPEPICHNNYGCRGKTGKLHMILFRLAVKDIPNGVPWLWFTQGVNNERNSDSNNDNRVPIPQRGLYVTRVESNGEYDDQSETVLPPGYLVLKKKPSDVGKKKTEKGEVPPPQIYDVKYVPDLDAKSLLRDVPMHINFHVKHLRQKHNKTREDFNGMFTRKRKR